MLGQEFLGTLASFRTKQQARLNLEKSHAENSARLFSQTLTDQDYINCVSMLLMEMDRLGMMSQTKYLAKKYFDMYLSMRPNQDLSRITLVLVTCLRIAAKFSESDQISKQLTTEFANQQCQYLFEEEEFNLCEVEVCKALGFKFHLVCPMDYFVVMDMMPYCLEVQTSLEPTIDFALSMAQARFCGAEQIFFGSLIYCCRQANVGPFFETIMKATTTKWEQSLQFYATLLKIESQVEEAARNEGAKMQEEQHRTNDGSFQEQNIHQFQYFEKGYNGNISF